LPRGNAVPYKKKFWFFFFAGRETKTFRFGAVRKNMRLTCVNTLANSY